MAQNFTKSDLIELRFALVHYAGFQAQLAATISNVEIANRHKAHEERLNELTEKVRVLISNANGNEI